MSDTGGYVLRLPASRKGAFLASLDLEGSFGEPVLDFRFSKRQPLICLILDEKDVITHIGLGRRGIAAGSGLRRLNTSDVHELSEIVTASKLLQQVPSRSIRWVRDKFEHGGLIQPKSFEYVIDALLNLAPETRPLIGRFGQERRDLIARWSPQVRQSLASQKETIATALAISRIDRRTLRNWEPQDGEPPSSFLEGLEEVRIREDPMVNNDLMNLPGYDLIKTLQYGAAIFEGDRERLTVILANRQPLEEQLGTDLIYYNETYRSFVMVQYKAMEREGSIDVFRLPNKQLTEEVRRMDKVLSELEKCPRDDDRDGFRLNTNPFFLKFCPRIVFNPDNEGLVAGMYIPLEYWRQTSDHPELLGPQGGLRLTHENARRYLGNSSFTQLVANAWVGTTLSQSAVLEEVIEETLKSGKAVAVAVKTIKPDLHVGSVSDFNPLEDLPSREGQKDSGKLEIKL